MEYNAIPPGIKPESAPPDLAESTPAPKRRYSGPPVAEIPAGGDWAETFWIRSTLSFDDVAAMEMERRRLNAGADGPDLMADVGMVLFLSGRLLERWTLEHAPASPEAFRALPSEMTQPVLEQVGHFLRKRSPAPPLTPTT